MLAAEIMGAIYRAVLEEWARRGHPVGGARVQLGKPRKIWIALRTIPRVRLGPVKVVVVGGGFAGFAAAIALQERRHEVVLLERRGVLGGRATSSRDAVTGEDVDNGTHLMIGAYTATLDLVRAGGGLRPRPRPGQPEARVGGREGRDAPSTARRSARPCTCWWASSACACRCR